jgi:hypothetical protein
MTERETEMGRQENEIAEINTVIEQIDDPREGYRIVREHIAEHQSRGEQVPADLIRMERLLFAECNAESQGR